MTQIEGRLQKRMTRRTRPHTLDEVEGVKRTPSDSRSTPQGGSVPLPTHTHARTVHRAERRGEVATRVGRRVLQMVVTMVSGAGSSRPVTTVRVRRRRAELLLLLALACALGGAG